MKAVALAASPSWASPLVETMALPVLLITLRPSQRLPTNAQGGYIKTWDDNDEGSTILLEVYTPTGIEQVKASESVVIYDLMGRRVTTMKSGVYIVNGKKVVIK